jgi:hypothetical protein
MNHYIYFEKETSNGASCCACGRDGRTVEAGGGEAAAQRREGTGNVLLYMCWHQNQGLSCVECMEPDR